jgi:hypothetical protein
VNVAQVMNTATHQILTIAAHSFASEELDPTLIVLVLTVICGLSKSVRCRSGSLSPITKVNQTSDLLHCENSALTHGH